MFFDVIIPTYQVSIDRVRRCLDSVLSQTFKEYQVWLCDGTPEEHHLNEELVRLLETEYPEVNLVRQTGIGVGQARNQAVNCGSSPYVAFLDADDYWNPEWLSEVHAHIIDKGFDGTAVVIGRAATKIPMRSMMSGRTWEIDSVIHGLDYESWIEPYHYAYVRKFPLYPSFTVVSREDFHRIGGFSEDMAIYEDTIFFSMICGSDSEDFRKKVVALDCEAGFKENHEESSVLGGSQSGLISEQGRGRIDYRREQAELILDNSSLDDSDLPDEIKAILKDMQITRNNWLHDSSEYLYGSSSN